MIYAIHKKTKEHKLVSSAKDGTNPGFYDSVFDRFRYVHADADGWIKWDQGECPLPHGALCDVKMENGWRSQGESQQFPAGAWGERFPCGEKIVAYRPVNNEKKTPHD